MKKKLLLLLPAMLALLGVCLYLAYPKEDDNFLMVEEGYVGTYTNNNTKLVSVPEGITEITYPETLKTIGEDAYKDCDLDAIIVPWGVKTLEGDTFYGTENVLAVFVPDTIRNYSESTFIAHHSVSQYEAKIYFYTGKDGEIEAYAVGDIDEEGYPTSPTVDEPGQIILEWQKQGFRTIEEICKGIEKPVEPGWRRIIGRDIYVKENGQLAKGFTKIDGDTYYFTEKGTPIIGLAMINGNEYLFDETGKLQKDKVSTGEEIWGKYSEDQSKLISFNAEAKKTSYPENLKIIGKNAYTGCVISPIVLPWGVTTIEDRAFAMSRTEAVFLPDTVNEVSENAYDIDRLAGLIVYHSDENGKMAAFVVDGEPAYTHQIYSLGDKEEPGTIITVWQEQGFRSIEDICKGIDGPPQTGWQELAGVRFYIHSDGTVAYDWTDIEGEQYYFYSDGTPAVGEITIYGEKYLFSDNGKLIE